MESTRPARSERRRVRTAAVAAVLTACASAVLFAHVQFSLLSSFRSTWAGGCGGDAVCSDIASPYEDTVDATSSYSNDFGNVVVDTTASPTRRICIDFPDTPTHIHDQVQFDRFVGTTSLDGCYQAAFNTLANPDYGATDIGTLVGTPQPISAWIYFNFNGLQYEVQWKRQGFGSIPSVAPPLKASYSALPDTWTLEPFTAAEMPSFFSDTCPNCNYDPQCPEGCATLMVFSNNKPRGRLALANYVMPLQLVVERDANNRRKPKGRQ